MVHQFELLVGVELLPCTQGWLRRQSGNIMLHLLREHGCSCVLRRRGKKKYNVKESRPSELQLRHTFPPTQENNVWKRSPQVAGRFRDALQIRLGSNGFAVFRSAAS